jgi:hypothetical protein
VPFAAIFLVCTLRDWFAKILHEGRRRREIPSDLLNFFRIGKELFDLGFGRLDAYELIEQPPRVEREPTDRHLAVCEFFDLVG